MSLAAVPAHILDRIETEASKAVIPDTRKTVYRPADPDLPTDAFCVQRPDGLIEVLYRPDSEKHRIYHQSNIPNLIMEGRRGTGKSHTMRWDFHIRAMAYPGFKYLILRRTMPELKKSHLLFLETDMEKLGGRALGVRAGNPQAFYPNGSLGIFGHCESESDVLKYLSSQFDAICFDEITTFRWEDITRISTCCRVLEGSGLTAIVRGGTNPIGESADDVYHYFIARDVLKEENPDYERNDWGALHIERSDASHIDFAQYDKQFSGLSQAYKDAWLEGKWGIEGAYFTIEAENLIQEMPLIKGNEDLPARPALDWEWMNVYRVFDYGFHDPAVCVWAMVLPNGRLMPFKEMSWVHRTAQEIIPDMLAASEGMNVLGTIADPTLWKGEQEMGHCMAHIFEDAGIMLTAGVNDRTANGFATQGLLSSKLADGLPAMIIYEPGCPTLIKTLRSMRVDKKHPGRIEDSKVDHMPIALGYLSMAAPPPTRIPRAERERPWMNHTASGRPLMGANNVRRRANSVYDSL